MVDPNDKVMSIKRQCDLLTVNRTALYYKPVGVSPRDLELMACMDRLHMDDPTQGTRRLTHALKQLGHKVGRCHVRTLMQKMRIRTVYCRPRTTAIDPTKHKYPYLLRNMTIERPNQVWAIDITYIPMRRGYMYLTAIIDLKSRYIVGWGISNTMDATWVVDTLRKAVARHGKPEIINSDQGSQFTSDAYVKYVNGLKTTKISMDGKGRALDNVFIERFWRTIKYDKLYLLDLATGTDVHRACHEFITYYNHRRGHSSLDMKTPQSVYLAAA